MLELFSEDFEVRDFLKRQRRIKFHRAIHIADRHADGFYRDLRRLSGNRNAAEREQRDYQDVRVWAKFHSDHHRLSLLLLRLLALEQFRKAAIENAAVPIVMMIFRAIDDGLAPKIKRSSQLHG